MLPVVRGEAETRRQILGYSILLFLVTVLLVPAGLGGTGLLFVCVILGGALVFLAVRLLVVATDAAALQLYRYSIAYLALLFVSMILDRTSGWIGLRGLL